MITVIVTDFSGAHVRRQQLCCLLLCGLTVAIVCSLSKDDYWETRCNSDYIPSVEFAPRIRVSAEVIISVEK